MEEIDFLSVDTVTAGYSCGDWCGRALGFLNIGRRIRFISKWGVFDLRGHGLGQWDGKGELT